MPGEVEQAKVERSRRGSYLDLEALARKGHSLWLEMMERSGYHRPSFCRSFGNGCEKCRSEMVPYDELPPETKERLIRRVGALQSWSTEPFCETPDEQEHLESHMLIQGQSDVHRSAPAIWPEPHHPGPSRTPR